MFDFLNKSEVQNVNNDWITSFCHLCYQYQKISKNKNIVLAMPQQNANLINFKKKSIFIYSVFQQRSKIIAIYDQKLKFSQKQQPKKGIYWFAFDKTCLYTTSGGQMADQGVIKINNNCYKLIDCIEGPNLQHFQCLNYSDPITKNIGDIVVLNVDIDNRKIISAFNKCDSFITKKFETTCWLKH